MSVKIIPPPRSALATSKRTIQSDLYIPDGEAVYVPEYVKIAAGVVLELGDGADLEIG